MPTDPSLILFKLYSPSSNTPVPPSPVDAVRVWWPSSAGYVVLPRATPGNGGHLWLGGASQWFCVVVGHPCPSCGGGSPWRCPFLPGPLSDLHLTSHSLTMAWGVKTALIQQK